MDKGNNTALQSGQKIIGGEDDAFLSEQIITYIGNKRALLVFIGEALDVVRKELKKEKIDLVDAFSGSGVVSRYFKQFSANLFSNDLEAYCQTINRCYLTNKEDLDFEALHAHYDAITDKLERLPLKKGFISELYAPQNDAAIKENERVFFTCRNANYIDTCRQYLEDVPQPYKGLLLAPLLYEASVHNNTSGVFKGFYKNSKTGIGQYGGNAQNALSRIKKEIKLPLPIFSNFNCAVHILKEDAAKLPHILPATDLVYLDPPYNQHPYGSNYFMLNLINSYQRPKNISRVSGIPKKWNRSRYNKKAESAEALATLCNELKTKYLLISFNSEGFVSLDEMKKILKKQGKVTILETKYNTFRGSRNLRGRNPYVKEYLYLVKKY
ncbi:MAG: DNA adenine methylase [Bdellovibrionota bacterium]